MRKGCPTAQWPKTRPNPWAGSISSLLFNGSQSAALRRPQARKSVVVLALALAVGNSLLYEAWRVPLAYPAVAGYPVDVAESRAVATWLFCCGLRGHDNRPPLGTT